ncbi:hypothetical protein F1559_004704 [Cyanidiococcus yangmingshanensis]|uniref:Uncharacterized protein n=1 Tax=Cyanidiococcus yangmingshanensis TaxID=2690220 RepID=A0A7J7INS9_9RHOD|nr:hypothetical protein F1559_004704 [Cyanidiococcus yangmingshanensis]
MRRSTTSGNGAGVSMPRSPERKPEPKAPRTAEPEVSTPSFQSAQVEQLMRARWIQVQELVQKQKEQSGPPEVVVFRGSAHAWENASKSLTRPRFLELVQRALQEKQQRR